MTREDERFLWQWCNTRCTCKYHNHITVADAAPVITFAATDHPCKQ